MIRNILGRLVGKALMLALSDRPHRIIYDRDGKKPYLHRHYLFGAPSMPDGSTPFDHFGNPKPRAVWKDGLGLYVHFFEQDDAPGALHNHPFEWMLSFILAGGYNEERRSGLWSVKWRTIKPFSFNFIRKDDFHRVELIDKRRGAWSLFLVGPKRSQWQFWSQDTGKTTHWRTYLEEQRKAAAVVRQWS